jgi:hypothetical protein
MFFGPALAAGADVGCVLSAAMWLVKIDLDCIDMCCTVDISERKKQCHKLLCSIDTAVPDHVALTASYETVQHIVHITTSAYRDDCDTGPL